MRFDVPSIRLGTSKTNAGINRFPDTLKLPDLSVAQVDIQRHRLLLWVKSPRIPAAPDTSGPGGSPDEIHAIPDIRTRMSGVGVIPEVLRRWL